jgi:hypothetical protein
MRSAIIVIGIDCAPQAKNIGVAVDGAAGDRCRVYEVFKCSLVSALIDRVASVLGRSSRALLSVDAPPGMASRPHLDSPVTEQADSSARMRTCFSVETWTGNFGRAMH